MRFRVAPGISPSPDASGTSFSHARAWFLVALSAWLVFIIDTVLVETGRAGSWDRHAELVVHDRAPQGWHGLMIDISAIGNGGEVLAAALFVGLVLCWSRKWSLAALCFLGPAGALVGESAMKGLTARSRPHLWPQAEVLHSYSFPSGHATGATALAAALTLVVMDRTTTRRKSPIILASALFALAVGFSRIYLGVHWPSDVVGGFTLGVAWVFGVAAALRAAV